MSTLISSLSHSQGQPPNQGQQSMYPQLPPWQQASTYGQQQVGGYGSANPPIPGQPVQSYGQAPSYGTGGYGGQSNAVQQINPYGAPSAPGASTTTGYRPGFYATGPQTSLGPQSVEVVGRDEDPIYGPLGRARAKVERALTSDSEISPDLGDALQAAINEPYVPLPGPAFRPMRIFKSTPLPDALHQELSFKHQTAKMGMFEEIERAWFTVDNKLFLWDYTDGREFSRYDQQQDIISCVGLVKARKDVFVDDITHLLVICTSTRITLLGLSRKSRELNLYATNLTADIPTPMLSVLGTAAGRIFMLGENKDLYELEYSIDRGWFFGGSSKAAVYNRTSGSLSNWVPSVFASSSREGVEKFCVDPTQDRLFTLHTRGEIVWYDVSGTNFNPRARYGRLRSDLITRGLAGQAPAHAGANIVSIAAVRRNESQRIVLVAITANGTRAYFSAAMFQYNPIIRPPPGNLTFSTQSFYSSGTVLGINNELSGPTPAAALNFITPHSGRQAAARENYEAFEPPVLQEWNVTETIPSQVWDVVEVPSTDPANSPLSLRRQDGVALSALPRQASTEARQFLVLATSGVFHILMPRPLDLLQTGLDVEKDAAITTVRNTFGKNQLAAMGIQMGYTGDMKQPDLASAVASILVGSGQPALRDSGRTIVYSSRHEGLALALGRILRPIWSTKVTSLVQGRQVLSVSEQVLVGVQSKLAALRKYVDDHPFPRHQADGEARLAWDQEELSLHGINVLLKQSVEAIAFILLLADYKISDIIAKCAADLQGRLSNLTYQGLLTSVDGRDIAKSLVTALIEQQIGQELSIDSLSEMLQQRCGTFVQPGDVVLYKAEESMRRGESAVDPMERSEALAESLRLFSKAAASLSTSRLQDVCKRYRDLQYTPGCIELPLRCASDIDPENKAADYTREGQHPNDPRKTMYTARMECYSCVIQALGMFDDLMDRATAQGHSGSAASKRNEAYSLAIASEDELFHFYLYDWHVSRGLAEQLLEYDTPFIEQYLRMTSNSVEERRDLLWKFYLRREDHLPAAKALFELATRPSPMMLNDRVAYLAQALTSAKSAGNLGAEDVEFISSLQERMDVANVQVEVVRAIEGHDDIAPAEKGQALSQLNAELTGLDELYQNVARPFRLYETILLILKTADTRIDEVIEAVWRQLLHEAAASAQPEAAMRATVTNLCRRYFPSEACPLDIVLTVVYTEAAQTGGPAGWASEAFLDGGVPLRDLWEGVMALSEEEGESEFYAEEAAVLASHWLRDRSAIPAAEVERFASAYLLRSNNAEQDGRRSGTKEKLSAAKAAAGRY